MVSTVSGQTGTRSITDSQKYGHLDSSLGFLFESSRKCSMKQPLLPLRKMAGEAVHQTQ
jgi:hypothetical protein